MKNLKRKIGELVGGEGFSSVSVTALVIAVVMVFNALLYVLVQNLGLVFSYTEKIDYSLTGDTDALFREAIESGKKVKISFCMAEDELKNHETGSEVYMTALQFAEKYPDFIELDYINIITRQDKDGNFIENFSKYRKDGEAIYGSSVIFECGDEIKVVTDTYSNAGFAPFYTLNSEMYVTAYSGEELFSAMICRVTSGNAKMAYFTQHHGEMADITFTNLLTSAGYDIDVINLRESAVPEDADLLIISNPTSDFEASWDGSVYTETDRLRAYMERGGNLYVSMDPYAKTLTVLEDFLREYGISFAYSENALGRRIKSIVKDPRNSITTDGFTLVCGYADSDVSRSISERVDKSLGGVLVRETGALELSGGAKAILTSSSASVLEAGGETVNGDGSYAVAASSSLTHKNGNTSRVFVIPSIYLTVSDALVSDGYSNKDFLFSTFEELFGATGLPYGTRPILYSSNILQNLTMETARIYTAIAVSVPVVIAAVGAVVLIRRKNR